MESLSSVYAAFVTECRYENLDAEVVLQAKKLLLDGLGVSLAGYQLMEFPRIVVDYMAELGGKEEATLIGKKRRIPAINALFGNASCAHALDMDDGHRFGAVHPGTVIIPCALAAAELAAADPKTLIAGIVAGYEVMIRLGMAIVPSSLTRGFHITGITGPLGAAATVGKIMGLSREEMVGAFGIAGLQGAGLIRTNHEPVGAKVKPINPARAATAGLLACVFARRGARGPLEIFEGEDGYFKAFTDQLKPEFLTADLGKKYEILNTYVKLYAACRHTHAPIDAALILLKRGEMAVSDISRIMVETYPAAIRLAGISHATTPTAGRFSIPFSIALALMKGDAGAAQYSDANIGDEEIQKLSAKVQVGVGRKWEESYPAKRGATVRMIDSRNRESFVEVDLAKGEPENPASWEEVYQKFCSNASLLIPQEEAGKLGEKIIHLEESAIEELVKLI